MYDVLYRKIIMDYGKIFMREHEEDNDAQIVYNKLTEYYLKLTKSSIRSYDLLSYITYNKLGREKWKGTRTIFILHWKDKIRLYEKLVEIIDHFSDHQKTQMLQNSVNKIRDLLRIKSQEDHNKTQYGTSLTFEQ